MSHALLFGHLKVLSNCIPFLILSWSRIDTPPFHCSDPISYPQLKFASAFHPLIRSKTTYPPFNFFRIVSLQYVSYSPEINYHFWIFPNFPVIADLEFLVLYFLMSTLLICFTELRHLGSMSCLFNRFSLKFIWYGTREGAWLIFLDILNSGEALLLESNLLSNERLKSFGRIWTFFVSSSATKWYLSVNYMLL